ncbi:interferon-induced, double-stranded RNA-activated protein kinase isoform X2 [Cyclopterus lumpus]|uniref:interferon-induced, double-stranded RNA-activated protein kinase isoform X2 n=1 Tax=Cyclopterus lumpus TaxID=8103 RepID=UPI0014866F3D|nr:interferon-induced, double-stranded RNA-activated protein kinase isoform X2 [Cyclopterus lumpus]
MAVAKLNEYAQKARLDLRYEDVGCDGLDHIRTFTVRAVLDGKTYDGVGKNKKEAKLKAAENAFSVLSEGTIDPTEKTTEASAAPTDQTSIPQAKYTCWLNEYGQQKRSDIRAVESTRLGPTGATQCCRFVVGDKEYPAATGRTKKDAKEEAAKLVYHEICGGNTTETRVEKSSGTSSQKKEESNRNVSDICNQMKSLSVITKDSKLSLLSAVSNEGLSSSTPESNNAKSKRVPMASSDSAVFTNSSNQDQIKSPDVKPKIRIAANFANACRNSKEDEMPNFRDKNPESSPSKKITTQSRFTTEYDSMVSLGKGTFGRVFRAKQKLLKKYYAVKIVRCKEIKKALREVMALSDLHHCNIVRYYSCWLEDSGYQWDSGDDSSSSSQSTDNTSVKYLYIQMELCDTKTLRVWIDEKNTQNVKKSLRDSKRREESLTIAQQIVSAVEYFHSKMLIHRDLKPANILFGQDGEVKIGDFGLVTEENNVDAENLLERTVYKGTPSYMAPEQRSRSIYDRKVDIFALGLVYFELLWNIFTGPEKKAIWEDARIQQFPEGFQHNFPLEITIIKSMLCQKSEDRPEASKLKQDLEKCSQTITMLKDARRLSRTV